MIYLYGLAEAPVSIIASALRQLAGLQGPLAVTSIAGWSLVHSTHDTAEVLPKRRLLLAHTRVLEKMIETGAVLPARFGLVADSLAQIEDLIVAREQTLQKEFARVAGCIELGVRIRFPRQAALATTLAADKELCKAQAHLHNSGPGAHFAIAEFGGKLADALDRRRGVAQKQILNALLPAVRDHVLCKPEDDTEVLRAEFLLPAHSHREFEALVIQAATALNFAQGHEPSIQFVGPAPLYHFVRLSLNIDAQEAA